MTDLFSSTASMCSISCVRTRACNCIAYFIPKEAYSIELGSNRRPPPTQQHAHTHIHIHIRIHKHMSPSCPMSAYRLALGGYGPWGTFFERFPCGKGSHGSHDVGAIIKEYYGHQPPLWPRPQQHDPHFVDTFLDDGTGKGKGKGKGNDNDQPPPGPGRTATATINTSTWAPASSTWSVQGSAYGAAMGAPRDLHRSTSSAAQFAPR